MKGYVLAHKQLLAGVLVLSTVVGVLATLAIVGTNLRPLQISAASTQVIVDTPPPSLVVRSIGAPDYDSLVKRAELFGRLIASPPVLDRAAKKLGVPPAQVGAFARITGPVPHALSEPDSEARASGVLLSKFRYRLELQARPNAPILAIYSQAPTTEEATALADAAVVALREHLGALALEQDFDAGRLVTVRQLGPARGGVVNSKAPVAMAVVTFFVGFALAGCILLGLIALRHRRALRELDGEKRREAPARRALDDWPRTTRLMPWTLAGFIAVLWLVPFNEIQLAFSLPIDLKFDRLILPFVVGAWLLALAAGRPLAPRMRLTPIHGAVAAFVGIAFISVVLDARYLNQSLELEQSLKRLPLLVAYVSLFFIAASAVRRTEVRAFFNLTLVLACICAIGVIWEYRMKVNVFLDFSDAFLPGFFSVGGADATGVDNIGRRVVRGPAAVPLETVAMLAMALPIALVGILHSKESRSRILHGLAICLLLAAAIATFRKSALLAPIAVIATVAYFRRRELFKLTPLAFVLVIALHILSPGALGSTTSQFEASRLGVATVSDRAIDYDAVRPDVWSHLIFGRGWGTYNHVDYRILDSEILQRLIETGVLGLIAFLAMGVTVVACTRRIIAARNPRSAPLALIGAAASVSFLVVTTLFDVLSFPHATYIFLYIAGLTATVVAQDEAEPEPEVEPRADGGHGGRVRHMRPAPRHPAARVR